MAGLPLKFRIQPTDVKAAALWGVTAATGALYLVQVSIFILRLQFRFSFFFGFSICLRKITSHVNDLYVIPCLDPHIR